MSWYKDQSPYEYEVPVICIEERPNSLRCRVIGTAREFFVPKVVIHDDSEVYKEGTEGKLVVFTSFAEEKGWN